MKKSILIIEDDEEIRNVMNMILTEEGYNVLTKPGMIELDPKDELPDLIILDNYLRGQTGHDICMQLKSVTVTACIPIILMSAGNNLNETAVSCHADACISKPFDIDDLTSCVKELLPL
ncbi:Response regulator receiver domain-containing protein [Pedobacter westerhofensis]|uniref:Response regulator receiver domain-containing protein n=1 Tax=Pedobacter westerhofensis TaxID=425512 RepID=A0A521ABP3_9SPHI|nr:response regulator [Pedobacter westerhofensis]SMO32198.1 Response regulator receiver domain-containing protein [Pedobacter westerhofensis]